MSENRKQSLTDVASLGEFGLIDRLTKNIRIFNKETLKGAGDDAAVISASDEILLATKDLLIEGIHFDAVFTPMKHLGYKAVAVNLSDIYAMNGIPKQIIVGLAVSSRYTVEALEELYDGMLKACSNYQVDMVGGDTTASPSGLFLSITVLGQAPKHKVVYRSGSSANELICVTGSLGAAYCGLLVLQREKAAFLANPNMQPYLEDYAYVVERQLKPEPRRDIIEKLDIAGVLPTSMIDISDGLASEILHLCRNSGNGAVIYEEQLPIDGRMATVAHEFNIDPTTCALSGGEDYELLFTIKQADYEKVKSIEGINVIGHMADVSTGTNLVTTSGQWIGLTAQGWDGLKQTRGTVS
ncbi:MAG TPA: thiamine-phosphate kinase [Bacteroidales bacterium]|nr:thiamine-phosphate kinase [Bacteroidales bacterium]